MDGWIDGWMEEGGSEERNKSMLNVVHRWRVMSYDARDFPVEVLLKLHFDRSPRETPDTQL